MVSKLEEFNKYVWDHTKDQFLLNFDEPNVIAQKYIDTLSSLVKKTNSNDEFLEGLKSAIDNDEDFLNLVIQLSGLTRNKIITDMKSMNVKFNLSPNNVTKNWNIVGEYIGTRFNRIIRPLINGDFQKALESLNYATWPGYIRQQKAKLMGHEAERRIAILLDNLGIKFDPQIKTTQPMSGDINFHGASVDLAVPSRNNPKVVIISTVHTSNIGQYGESKDKSEAVALREIIDKLEGVKPLLVLMIDGVGLHSNIAGLKGSLDACDEFVQFETLWKLPVILKKVMPENTSDFNLYLPSDDRVYFEPFLRTFNFPTQFLLETPPTNKVVWKGIRPNPAIISRN